MTYPCPHCNFTADLTTGCRGCGRGPDPDAAAVLRLDAEIAPLTARLAEARTTVATLDAQLADLWQRRNAAAARVRAAVAAVPPPAPPIPAVPRAPRSKEASTRLIQNALFLLGGVLLGVAAIVFTAVAWSQFGVYGRALLLAGFTVAALAVPPLALRRGLTATAETFAAVGLLMVLLDGYAAWYVNLFGLAAYSPLGYAGAVFAVTAAIAAGYEHVTGLTGPRFAALVAAQPVLPLLVAPLHPGATGWSFTLSTVALLDLAVVHLRSMVFSPIGITAYAFGLFSIVGAGSSALIALALADRPGPAAAAGAALATAALVPVAGAMLARAALAQSIFGGALVVALGIAGARLADLAGGSASPVLIAAVAVVLAVIVAAAAGTLPPAVRRGPWIGALLVVGVPALVAAVDAMLAAVPPVDTVVPSGDWRSAATLALLTAGLAVLVRRPWVPFSGAALLAFAAPAAFGLPWWSAPIADLAVAAAGLVLALRATSRGALLWPATVAAVLGAHAVAVGFARPAVAAGTLAAIAVLGIGTAAAARSVVLLARHSVVMAAGVLLRRRALGGVALTVGLLAIPPLAAMVAAASSVSAAGQARLALAGAALLAGALHLVARRWAEYRGFALAAVLLTVVSAPAFGAEAGEPTSIYAGVALVLVALTISALPLRHVPSPSVLPPLAAPAPARFAASGVRGRDLAATWVTAALLALTLAAAAARSLLGVLVLPLGWWSRAWAGRPDGTGIDPYLDAHIAMTDAVAVLLLAVAVALAAWFRGDWRAAAWAAAPTAGVGLPMVLAAADVPWPGVPAASLLSGLTGLLAAALRPSSASGTGGLGAAGTGTSALPAARAVVAVVSGVLAVTGLSGALPTRGSTLAALGAVVIAGVVAGVAARGMAARVAGRLAAAVAVLAFAFTTGSAFDLSRQVTAFAVLGAAALVLAAGTLLQRPERSRIEGWAVEAAGHAGAVLALLLTAGSARYAAAVCTFWGLALGLRALPPGERAVVRRAFIVAAAVAELGGWWLLIVSAHVSTLEAYTLPAAAVALLAGRLALRSRPGLSSWTAYGPALAAALLPTLASVLTGDGHPVRRLLLGLGALAVVLAGAQARLKAPVVTGGAVLTVVALHELTLVWDLLPRWIPLAVGGLLLVGLAMTLERRRRDLDRFRAALTRMS